MDSKISTIVEKFENKIPLATHEEVYIVQEYIYVRKGRRVTVRLNGENMSRVFPNVFINECMKLSQAANVAISHFILNKL